MPWPGASAQCCTTWSGAGQLQIAVLIISFIVSVIGLVAVVLWIAQRQVKGITVRLLLFLYSGAAVANILITRGNPVPAGHRPLGASHHRYGI